MAAGVVANLDIDRAVTGETDRGGVGDVLRMGMRRADDVVALLKAVGDNAAARAARELGQTRGVAADDHGAVLAYETHELSEGALNLLKGAVVVKMVRLDVGDDHYVGVEVEEGAVGLVRLGDKVGAVTVLAVGVKALDDTADEEARILPHAIEHGGDHGRGRGLAVRARHGNGGVALAECREHLGTGPHGDAELARTGELGVGLGDSRGDDHHVGAHLVDGGGGVTDVDIDAGTRELADVARGLEVRTRDRKTALVQDERDTAHARTANTNEMGALERGRCGRGRGVCHAYAP